MTPAASATQPRLGGLRGQSDQQCDDALVLSVTPEALGGCEDGLSRGEGAQVRCMKMEL